MPVTMASRETISDLSGAMRRRRALATNIGLAVGLAVFVVVLFVVVVSHMQEKAAEQLLGAGQCAAQTTSKGLECGGTLVLKKISTLWQVVRDLGRISHLHLHTVVPLVDKRQH